MGTRPTYTTAFREQIVALYRSGRTITELADEFQPSVWTIRNWIRQADRDEGHRPDGIPTPEREELTRLRRENRRLKLERDILAKAAAWFAQEGAGLPPSSDL